MSIHSKPRIIQLPLPGEDVHIPLTRGYETIVSWQDRDLVELKWNAGQTQGGFYAQRWTSRKQDHRIIRIHRLILERMLRRALNENEYVDHINGNTLDNRRANLRLCTMSQNLHNSHKSRNNTSGYKGVSWHKLAKKWRADIRMGKQIYLGLYDTPEEAHEAYCKAAYELFGQFARVE